MPRHHPGTYVANNNLELSSVPRALTTHLLSVNHEQLLDVTCHPFLAAAANGTLSKPVIAHWLANCIPYLESYTKVLSNTLDQVRQQASQPNLDSQQTALDARMAASLESALENAKRESEFIIEVADIYDIDVSTAASGLQVSSPGLYRYQALFDAVNTNSINRFLPWLEGLVLIWATEKLYYESWSWAHRQQTASQRPSEDEDDGAMRREFIPNWSNSHYMLFVEQLERVLNESVSHAIGKDDMRWAEAQSRADAVWKAILNAEDGFWPDVSVLKEEYFREPITGQDRSTLSRMNEQVLHAVALTAFPTHGSAPIHT